MVDIIQILKWPGVVLLIALFAFIFFKKQFAALLDRTKKLGKGGLETYEAQISHPPKEQKGVDVFFREFENPLLIEGEELIRKDLKARIIEVPEDREKALIRALAATNITLHFERFYQAIWASQISALRYLNARIDGANDIDLSSLFYEKAKIEYPSWYTDYSFEKWLGFMESAKLIQRRNGQLHITILGREFLKFLIDTGKPGPFHG